MDPYYDSEGVTIYHGDCREIMPEIRAQSVVTDPVWPDAKVPLAGFDRPRELFAESMAALPEEVVRVAVHLGLDSNPDFLDPVPMPFFRSCQMLMSKPHYKGRLLYDRDVAYLYGTPPPSRPGARVIPGQAQATENLGRECGHPCPRKLSHVRWLVRWWSSPDDVVLDPFNGGGTTTLAAKMEGRRVIGIEIEERYCEMAAARLSQMQLFAPAQGVTND